MNECLCISFLCSVLSIVGLSFIPTSRIVILLIPSLPPLLFIIIILGVIIIVIILIIAAAATAAAAPNKGDGEAGAKRSCGCGASLHVDPRFLHRGLPDCRGVPGWLRLHNKEGGAERGSDRTSKPSSWFRKVEQSHLRRVHGRNAVVLLHQRETAVDVAAAFRDYHDATDAL